jgi:hypothetical protein
MLLRLRPTTAKFVVERGKRGERGTRVEKSCEREKVVQGWLASSLAGRKLSGREGGRVVTETCVGSAAG